MITFEEAYAKACAFLPLIDTCTEYENGYVFTPANADDYIGGYGHTPCVILKENGRRTVMSAFIANGTGKELQTIDLAEREQALLVQRAIQAANNAYAPYSEHIVGAALLCCNRHIYTGCNIESAVHTPTVCAERTAFFKAISEGERSFAAIAIVGGMKGDFREFCPPCGVCRQVMREFCSADFRVILGRKDGKMKVFSLEELLPEAFMLEK